MLKRWRREGGMRKLEWECCGRLHFPKKPLSMLPIRVLCYYVVLPISHAEMESYSPLASWPICYHQNAVEVMLSDFQNQVRKDHDFDFFSLGIPAFRTFICHLRSLLTLRPQCWRDHCSSLSWSSPQPC